MFWWLSEAHRVAGHGLGQNLDRHLSPELGVLGTVDLSHTAFAELGGDVEMRERFADHSDAAELTYLR